MNTARERSLLPFMPALIATSLLALAFKAHCLPGGWTGAEQYTTGCYSDAVPFWTGRGVAAGEVPYFEARLEYPVLTGAAIWAQGVATRLFFGGDASAANFLFLVWIVNAALAAMVLVMLARMNLPATRLWAWALGPPLLLYLGHNWDMLAVAFTTLALLLASRERPILAATVAGLGVAAKLFPVVLLPLLVLGALFSRDAFAGRLPAWPAPDRLRAAALVAAAAVAAWLLVNLPVALAALENWWEFYRFSSERSGTAASVWELLQQFGLLATSTPARNKLAALLFAAGAVAITLIGWRRHSDRPWVMFTPVLAWFMLTNKVYSPQFDLWLYPMLLITCRRPALIAAFVAAGIAAYFAEFWFFAASEGAHPQATQTHIALAAATRAAAMLAIIWSAVAEPGPEWLDRQDADEPVSECKTMVV